MLILISMKTLHFLSQLIVKNSGEVRLDFLETTFEDKLKRTLKLYYLRYILFY